MGLPDLQCHLGECWYRWDGTLRFCINERMIEKDTYPLPRIEERLYALHGMALLCPVNMA